MRKITTILSLMVLLMIAGSAGAAENINRAFGRSVVRQFAGDFIERASAAQRTAPSLGIRVNAGGDGCYEWDAANECVWLGDQTDSNPYGTGGGSEKCPENKDYASCKKKCECEYNKNLQRCGTSPICRDLAFAEKDACIGGCISDW